MNHNSKSKYFTKTTNLKWWYFSAICFVRDENLCDVAIERHALLSSYTLQLIFGVGIFISINSFISSRNVIVGKTSSDTFIHKLVSCQKCDVKKLPGMLFPVYIAVLKRLGRIGCIFATESAAMWRIICNQNERIWENLNVVIYYSVGNLSFR